MLALLTNHMRKDYKLPPGIFCDKFINEVRKKFKSRYKWLGATVQK